jgi:hypothetical protein
MSAASSFLLNRLDHNSHPSNTFDAETASASPNAAGMSNIKKEPEDYRSRNSLDSLTIPKNAVPCVRGGHGGRCIHTP